MVNQFISANTNSTFLFSLNLKIEFYKTNRNIAKSIEALLLVLLIAFDIINLTISNIFLNKKHLT